MNIQPVVGVYGLYPVNDNISKMRANRCKLHEFTFTKCVLQS